MAQIGLTSTKTLTSMLNHCFYSPLSFYMLVWGQEYVRNPKTTKVYVGLSAYC